MLTNNWYVVYKSNRQRGVISKALVNTAGSAVDSGYNTSNAAYAMAALTLYAESVVLNNSSRGVVLGRSTTPAALSDHSLKSQITSGITTNLASRFDDAYNTVYTVTVTNTGSEDLTVGEIGIQGTAYTGQNTSSSQTVLMDRTVLDAPVTIPPNGVAVLTYILRTIVPTA